MTNNFQTNQFVHNELNRRFSSSHKSESRGFPRDQKLWDWESETKTVRPVGLNTYSIRDMLVRLHARKEYAHATQRIHACLIRNCFHFLQRYPSDVNPSWTETYMETETPTLEIETRSPDTETIKNWSRGLTYLVFSCYNENFFAENYSVHCLASSWNTSVLAGKIFSGIQHVQFRWKNLALLKIFTISTNKFFSC